MSPEVGLPRVTSTITRQPLPKAEDAGTGWPWSDEISQVAPRRADGSEWPRISIITPSFNQGPFIEETIRSILLQGYPNLEYIVVDGGSRDETIRILEKYRPWLDHCVIEPDTGQSNAINKGFKMATGEIVQWINSDDLLLPQALERVGAAYDWERPRLIAGDVLEFGLNRDRFVPNRHLGVSGFLRASDMTFHQPGLWMDARTCKAIGLVREDLHYAMDWHYLIKYLDRCPDVTYLDETLVHFRLHENSKSVHLVGKFAQDRLKAAHLLVNEDISPASRTLCRHHIEGLVWFDHVAALSKSVEEGAVGRRRAFFTLLSGIMMRPTLRLNRFSLGALRQTLGSRVATPSDN